MIIYCHLYNLKKEVAQGLTPKEHGQLFQAMMSLCYLPEDVVSYFEVTFSQFQNISSNIISI